MLLEVTLNVLITTEHVDCFVGNIWLLNYLDTTLKEVSSVLILYIYNLQTSDIYVF